MGALTADGWAQEAAAFRIAFVLSLLLCRAQVATGVDSGSPVCTLAIFRSPSCAHCESVEPPALEKLGRKLGCKIELKIYDIDDIENYRLLLKIEKALGDTDNEFPIVVVGDKLLADNAEITKGLEQTLRDAIAAGPSGPHGVVTRLRFGEWLHGDMGNSYDRLLLEYDRCQHRGKGKKGGTFPLTLQRRG